MPKTAFRIVALAAACIVQLSFVSTLFFPLNTIQILLVYAILILFLSSTTSALYHALIFGFFLDIYSPYPFGIYIVASVAGIGAAYVCLRTFLTNRSIYSLIFLTLLATAGFEIIRVAAVWLAYNFTDNMLYVQTGGMAQALNIGFALAGNAILAAISFYVIHYFSNLLEPFFIRKNK